LRRGPSVSEAQAAEVRDLLGRVRRWAAERPDVVAVALAGSWARGVPNTDSDVDLVVLTTAKKDYLEGESWMEELGGVRVVRTQDWGPLYTERRFVLPSGLVVEFGVAPPVWAATDPPDPGTRKAVRGGGLHALYDPEGLLERLISACQ
jgi:uncharacterized protein